MLSQQNVLVIGARAGGYGESIARAAVQAGATVFGTTLNPNDPREKAFFKEVGVELIDVPLRFDADNRVSVTRAFEAICEWFKTRRIAPLHSVIHAVAGGFPRQPSVMKAVVDILKGKLVFNDLATAVKRNVYYVNAGSYDDTVKGLAPVSDGRTCFTGLTYRGALPYFISPTKVYLEKLAKRAARKGINSLVAAFPEAWTQSSQFFTGIEMAVLHHYLTDLSGDGPDSEPLFSLFGRMKAALESLEAFPALLSDLSAFFSNKWAEVSVSGYERLSAEIEALYSELRRKGSFPVMRKAVEIISEFVRDASATLLVDKLLGEGQFNAGDVKQIYYGDLLGGTTIGNATPKPKAVTHIQAKEWVRYGKEDVSATLSMYGKNFLFLDNVVMEKGDIYDGFKGFARFTVPSPEENPILKDHFIGMPLFGGHLQMEAVAQFAAFLILKVQKSKRLLPILTGTEFPDINTMAPPGETLTIMGTIRLQERRKLTLEAVIENRFARSKGTIKGLVLSDRVLKKMMGSFFSGESAEEAVGDSNE
jgi:3-hydroxymyristoyl/3-hydroxydecanoyl-(acyl carrier protein) dehydratase/NAD(P)-dependent dehydrogenase (short-subunit alcohol dehydrogenase family)